MHTLQPIRLYGTIFKNTNTEDFPSVLQRASPGRTTFKLQCRSRRFVASIRPTSKLSYSIATCQPPRRGCRAVPLKLRSETSGHICCYSVTGGVAKIWQVPCRVEADFRDCLPIRSMLNSVQEARSVQRAESWLYRVIFPDFSPPFIAKRDFDVVVISRGV